MTASRQTLDHCAKLCAAVYRVTGQSPSDEILRNELRSTSLDILKNAILVLENPARKNAEEEQAKNYAELERHKHYISYLLSIAQDQPFGYAQGEQNVNPLNFMVLAREYEQFFGELTASLNHAEPLPSANSTRNNAEDEESSNVKAQTSNEAALHKNKAERRKKEQDLTGLSDRQRRIMQYIQKSRRAKAGDMFSTFSNFNRRTIQRDIQALETNGLIRSRGTTHDREYHLV